MTGVAPALAEPQIGAAPAVATSMCASVKYPRLAARISSGIRTALAGRTHSVVGLKASAPGFGLTCWLNQNAHFYAASVIKVTILSALLFKEHGPSHLTRQQRNLAFLMITQSNNYAATALWDEVGMRGMRVFLRRAAMPHTILSQAWGLTLITARDELTLLHLLTRPGDVLGKYSRRYVLTLMAEVIPAERWGVSAGAARGITVHIKNGWLPYPEGDDWNINSIGAFTGNDISYQIVILTGPPAAGGQGEGYGIQTIEDAADVINRILARRLGLRSAPVRLPDAAALAEPGG